VDIGIVLLRAIVGLTLAAHGAQKLFGWFNGPGLTGTAAGLEHLGFRPGYRHAITAGAVETVGGLLLTIGLFTPLAASIVVSVMIVAAVSAHLKKGFFITSGGYEYNVVLGASALAIAFTGPGRVSLDALLGFLVGGSAWGVGALLVGIAGAAMQLTQRHPSTV